MSLPLFSIYIVQSVQGENADFLMHTERGRHFVEVIAKYIGEYLKSLMLYWNYVPLYFLYFCHFFQFLFICLCVYSFSCVLDSDLDITENWRNKGSRIILNLKIITKTVEF